MSRKHRNPHSTPASAKQAASLTPRSQERGVGKIRVMIRSEGVRLVRHVALKESPVLLRHTEHLAARIPHLFTKDWRCKTIWGLEHCYAFEMAPVCSDGIGVDLDQIVRDGLMALEKATQKLKELAQQGQVASLRKLDISSAEFAVLRCLRKIQAAGGEVYFSVASEPPRELDATNRLVPSKLIDGSVPAFEDTAVQMPIKSLTDELFLAVVKEDRSAARVTGRVIGVTDLPDARVAIIINGGRAMPAPDLSRETAIELYRASAEVQGLLTPIGTELVLTRLTWQAGLPFEPAQT